MFDVPEDEEVDDNIDDVWNQVRQSFIAAFPTHNHLIPKERQRPAQRKHLYDERGSRYNNESDGSIYRVPEFRHDGPEQRQVEVKD